ncbi:MAG: hypothetical protein GKR89_26090 [Candidatus Latescibacteria bacterium]|nr:hypothetical protein [Candidatus Latescibacterota bacterium]
MYTIGIDGGGTRTRVALVNEQGKVCRTARAGCGNYQVLGLEGLEKRVAGLLGELGLTRSQRLCACLALAGAGRPEEQAAIVEGLQRRWPHRCKQRSLATPREPWKGPWGDVPV